MSSLDRCARREIGLADEGPARYLHENSSKMLIFTKFLAIRLKAFFVKA